MTNDMLRDARCHLILGNTYHLGNQPGADTVEALGGLHDFTGWDRAMLTDSGAQRTPFLTHRKLFAFMLLSPQKERHKKVLSASATPIHCTE